MRGERGEERRLERRDTWRPERSRAGEESGRQRRDRELEKVEGSDEKQQK